MGAALVAVDSCNLGGQMRLVLDKVQMTLRFLDSIVGLDPGLSTFRAIKSAPLGKIKADVEVLFIRVEFRC
jgi:hypothetical protein